MKITTLRNLFFAVSFITSANLYAGGTNTGCPTITVTFKTTSVSCYGGTTGKAVANATGGKTPYTYSWNTGSSADSITNVAAGTYTISVTDSNSCVTTATVNITQPASKLSLSSATSGTSCGACNGSVKVTPYGGTPVYKYMWSNGETNASFGNMCAGTYTLIVSDANGCTLDTNIFISALSPLRDSIINIQNVTCNNGSNGSATVGVKGGMAPYTYSWGTVPTQSTATVSNLGAGTYTCTVADSNGCIVTTTVTITEPAIVIPTVTITPTVICLGDLASLTTSATGGTAPYYFSWSPSNCTSTPCGISPPVTTTYTIIVTDFNNCPGTPITATLQVNPPLQVITSGNSTICAAGSASLGAQANGGDGVYTYTWAPATGLSCDTCQNPIATPTTTTEYTVTVRDNCSTPPVQDSVQVVVEPSPQVTITISGGDSICPGSSVTLTANGALTYSWSPTTGIVSSTGSSITVAPSVNTTYTGVGANSSGCVDSATISISVIPIASAKFTTTGLCSSGNTIAFTDVSTGSEIQWGWNFGDGATSTLQNPVHTYPASGTYTVMEAVQSQCGDADTIKMPVHVNPGQGFDLTGSLQICIDTPGVSTASIQACIYNDRCDVVKGTMKLVLDTAIHITKTISDSIAHVSGDTLIWNYNGLSDTGSMHCVTLTGSVSTLPKGDSVFASLLITPVAGDSVPSNNSYTYWVKPGLQNCVGLPFDPNEKSVLPQGDISATQQLTYTIHFQNTGTAPAKNVVVVDTLSQYVDPTTLKIISSSSEVITTIASGHIVKFTFNGINLPDTATSKTKSIGVFKYTIYPMRTDTGGEVIKNSAGIYFDANAVVETNTTTNAIARTVLSIDNINAPTLNIRCFPNPFTSTTSLVFNTDGRHYIEVDDMTGRILETIECTGKQYELQRNNLSAGIYFIKAYNADRSNVAVTKVVLQ